MLLFSFIVFLLLARNYLRRSSAYLCMRKRSQRDQDRIPLDHKIEVVARKRSGEARRRKKAEATMAGQDQREIGS